MAIPIDGALATVSHLASDTGTEIILDLPAEPVIAEIDPRRVERILRNLLANAIDHGERKPITLTMRSDGDAVAITVRDQGIGLRPGEEKLVFNRFWRSDPSRFRRSGGTGLGLAISIEDARLHQGRLDAWGEPGKGACFRLTIPLIRGHKVLGSPLPLKPVGQPVRSLPAKSSTKTVVTRLDDPGTSDAVGEDDTADKTDTAQRTSSADKADLADRADASDGEQR